MFKEEESPTEQYEALIKANEYAASKTLPQVKNGKKEKHANNPKVQQARKKVDEMARKYATSKSSVIRKCLQQAKANLQVVYQRIEEDILQSQIEKISTNFHHKDTGSAWKIVNTITSRKSAPAGKLKGKTPDERKQQWFNHFKKLLGSPIEQSETPNILTVLSPEQVQIDSSKFVLEEVIKARKDVKEGTAAGEDDIMPEVIQRINIDDIILRHANSLLEEQEKPDQFSILNLIPLPKSGDLGVTDNYRGIALSSLVAKIVNKMLLNRIRPKLDPLLRGNQSGFRPGRSTIAQILALRRIIEEVKKCNLPAVMVFIDFCKAFDSICHQAMFAILEAYGIPPKIVNAIKEVYRNVKAKVKSPDGDTDFFDILAGVLQGDTLAPCIFVIVLDYAMRQAIEGKEEELGLTLYPRQSRRIPAQSITDLDFADDIVLLSNNIEQAKRLLNRVEQECKKIGLRMNAKKTKSMFFNAAIEVIITDEGSNIKQALTDDTQEQDFKYLGSWSEKNRDINVRKALAWRSLHKLKPIWKSNLNRELKIRLFRATTESILLYGCGTWSLTKQEEKSLDGTYTRMLRMVLNIRWDEHITNEALYGSLSKVSNTIRSRRLQLAGHVFRDVSSPAHLTVTWKPTHGNIKSGRPTTTYVDTLLRDTGTDNVKELESCMKDRDIWRRFSSRCLGIDRK